MPAHRVQHHLNVGILHFGMYTDRQMPYATGLAVIALGVVSGATGGSVVVRLAIGLLVITPALVMVLDNHGGGILRQYLRSWMEYRRVPGVYVPGAEFDDTPGYVLEDPEATARSAQPKIATLHDD